VAELILRKFRKKFHTRYLNQWLAQRHITPQKPSRQARERNEREIRRWVREEWPRIKKVPGVGVPISS
jgi:transposase